MNTSLASTVFSLRSSNLPSNFSLPTLGLALIPSGLRLLGFTFFAVVAVGLMLARPALAGDGISSAAVRRAAVFLERSDRCEMVHSYLHMGSTYSGQKFIKGMKVDDGRGGAIPGEFVLVYRYFWNDDDSTDVAFFCNVSGQVESLRVLRTSAILQQPFLISNGMVQLIGNAIIEAFLEDMTPADRSQLQRLVSESDTKGLLEFSLRLQQVLGS